MEPSLFWLGTSESGPLLDTSRARSFSSGDAESARRLRPVPCQALPGCVVPPYARVEAGSIRLELDDVLYGDLAPELRDALEDRGAVRRLDAQECADLEKRFGRTFVSRVLVEEAAEDTSCVPWLFPDKPDAPKPVAILKRDRLLKLVRQAYFSLLRLLTIMAAREKWALKLKDMVDFGAECAKFGDDDLFNLRLNHVPPDIFHEQDEIDEALAGFALNNDRIDANRDLLSANLALLDAELRRPI